MRTIRNYISEIKNTVAKDYPNLDDRLVLELIDQYRAIQIKNDLNAKMTPPSQIKQTITGIALELTKTTMLGFITDSNRILKSIVKLPQVINTLHKPLVLNVFSDKILSTSFNFVTRDTAVFSGNGRYNSKDIYCFLYNDYLYIKLKKQNPNINLLDFITLEAIFEHPAECIPLQNKTYVDFLDYEYPISESMWGYIKSSIIKNSFSVIESEINE